MFYYAMLCILYIFILPGWMMMAMTMMIVELAFIGFGSCCIGLKAIKCYKISR